jgi:hypothetical protein
MTMRRSANAASASADDASGARLALSAEKFINCRVHKNCAYEWCEFKRLPWEFRAVRDRNAARSAARDSRAGRSAGRADASAAAWVTAAKREEKLWSIEGEKERQRLRMEEAKATRQADKDARFAASHDRRLTTEANRMRNKMGTKGLKRYNSTSSVDSATANAHERAMMVYEQRMSRCRGLMRSRALALAHADTVAVDPVTNEVLYTLDAEQLTEVLKRERLLEEQVETAAQKTGFRVAPGPKVGDMYRLPKLYEEIWLYEDPAHGDDDVTDAELLEMMVDMHTAEY